MRALSEGSTPGAITAGGCTPEKPVTTALPFSTMPDDWADAEPQASEPNAATANIAARIRPARQERSLRPRRIEQSIFVCIGSAPGETTIRCI